MMHYEIDFSIDGKSHHTCGESSFPTDKNFAMKHYTNDDFIEISRVLISAYMKMGRMERNVDEGSIRCRVTKK